MTGMLAFFACSRTDCQPSWVLGLKAMASTFCWMKERMARSWFSWSPWASENLRSTLRFWASDLMEAVLAVRQPLSAPIWLKPTVRRAGAGAGAAPVGVFFSQPDGDGAGAAGRGGR